MLGYRNWRETCDTINSVLKASIKIPAIPIRYQVPEISEIPQYDITNYR